MSSSKLTQLLCHFCLSHILVHLWLDSDPIPVGNAGIIDVIKKESIDLIWFPSCKCAFLPFSNRLIILGGCVLICLSTVTIAVVILWVWHLLAFWTTLPSLLSCMLAFSVPKLFVDAGTTGPSATKHQAHFFCKRAGEISSAASGTITAGWASSVTEIDTLDISKPSWPTFQCFHHRASSELSRWQAAKMPGARRCSSLISVFCTPL